MKNDELGRVYGDGELIFREGDEGDRMYVIQSGKVKISKKTTSGDYTIATLQSGEIFGEMAMFDRLPRSATATAEGEARILGIDKQKLFQSINRDPTLVLKVIEAMSRRIRLLDEYFTKTDRGRTELLKIFLSTEEICKFILEEVKNIIMADNGSIMLYNDNEKKLVISAAFGEDWKPKISFEHGEGIAGDVLRTGKAELINNVSLDPRFKSGPSSIVSILCVPLKGRNGCFGVINMSRTSEKMFNLEELKVLHAIALYASIAIENATGFSKLHDITDELLKHATLLDMW